MGCKHYAGLTGEVGIIMCIVEYVKGFRVFVQLKNDEKRGRVHDLWKFNTRPNKIENELRNAANDAGRNLVADNWMLVMPTNVRVISPSEYAAAGGAGAARP